MEGPISKYIPKLASVQAQVKMPTLSSTCFLFKLQHWKLDMCIQRGREESCNRRCGGQCWTTLDNAVSVPIHILICPTLHTALSLQYCTFSYFPSIYIPKDCLILSFVFLLSLHSNNNFLSYLYRISITFVLYLYLFVSLLLVHPYDNPPSVPPTSALQSLPSPSSLSSEACTL